MSQTPPSRAGNRHILGLDSLRFICAIWVAMHHGARPGVAAWLGLSGVAEDWNAIAFDGVAAVIVFFMISGLCVHYPYSRSEPCHLLPYFTQRFVRVGIPLLVVVGFVKFSGGLVGDDIATAPRIVLWSLWCELIYYAIYPALLIGFRRIGFVPLLAAAFIAAYSVIIAHWHLMTYWQYPYTLAWVVALPAWLLGCAIAQILAARRLPALPGSVLWWRAAAIFLSIPPKALVYASVSPVLIGNPATLGVFSLFVFPWLMKEISAFRENPPPAPLEWGGRWSYSLYLVHTTVIAALVHVAGRIDPLIRWPLKLAAILVVAYLFYCIVERPGHMLARSIGRRLARQRKAGGTVNTGASA